MVEGTCVNLYEGPGIQIQKALIAACLYREPDVIVGFPGEKLRPLFLETYNFLKELPVFLTCTVFTYFR